MAEIYAPCPQCGYRVARSLDHDAGQCARTDPHQHLICTSCLHHWVAEPGAGR